MLSRTAKKNAISGKDRSGKILYVTFLIYFLYPIFRDVLPLNDYFWMLSMIAGLFACAYCFDLGIVITPASVLWMVLAMMALSSFIMLGPDNTVLPKRMGLFLMSLLMMILLGKDRRWIRPALMACLALLTVHAVATIVLNAMPSLYEQFVSPAIQGSSVTVIGPKAGITSHYSYNGQFMAIGLLISYVLFKMSPLRDGVKTDRIKFAAMALMFFASLLLTTKRTPLLICLFAVVLTEFLLAGRGKATTFCKVLAAAYFLSIVIIAFGDQIPMLSNVMERLSAFFTADSLEESTTGRTVLWERAIQLWNESPIFGSGWGTYRYYWANGYQGVSTAAHNVFLQLLAEVGVVGLLVFLIPSLHVLFGLAKSVFRLTRGHVEQYEFSDAALLFAFLFQIYFFVYCFVGAPLYDFESFPVYFVLSCGVWYATNGSQEMARAKTVTAPSGAHGNVQVKYHA